MSKVLQKSAPNCGSPRPAGRSARRFRLIFKELLNVIYLPIGCFPEMNTKYTENKIRRTNNKNEIH